MKSPIHLHCMARRLRPLCAAVLLLLLAQSSTEISAQTVAPVLPQDLVAACAPLAYTPIKTPPPDAIAAAISASKRYRLVIGVGEYAANPEMNRDYVDPTAQMVDQRLAEVGYTALPTLPKDRPLLTGTAATKSAIMDALQEMVKLTSTGDTGVIYYVGHGLMAPSNSDVTLGVYDRPVQPDEGIRVSDILGTLAFNRYRGTIVQIPHFIVVIDACVSGNAAIGDATTIADRNGIERIVNITYQQIAPQMAILTATSDGKNPEAYELGKSGYSAFGFFFARALKEDWACADTDSPDGILTLHELQSYLRRKLDRAQQEQAIPDAMTPRILSADRNAFIAYDPSKHYVDGAREDIVTVALNAGLTNFATLTLASGVTLTCDPLTKCSFSVSKQLLAGEARITKTPDTRFAVVEGQPNLLSTTGSLDLKILLQSKSLTVAGVKVSIQ